LERIPIETKKMNADRAKVILNMIEKFEEDEDVQDVFHTLTISED
jgi:transcriptional/translational regulatory protein YebC/TACO1